MMNERKKMPQLSHMLICLGFGALAGFIAGWANTSYAGLVTPLYFIRPNLFTIFVVSVIAPIVEEPLKPLGLYFLREEEKVSLRLRDWVILGTFAGLGFGLLENISYALEVSSYGVSVAFALFGLRTFASLPVHAIATTISGFGIGLWAKTGKTGYFFKFLVVSVLIHGLYNFTVTMMG